MIKIFTPRCRGKAYSQKQIVKLMEDKFMDIIDSEKVNIRYEIFKALNPDLENGRDKMMRYRKWVTEQMKAAFYDNNKSVLRNSYDGSFTIRDHWQFDDYLKDQFPESGVF